MTEEHHKIKKPSKGKTTVTLVALPYDRETSKKTKTRYLGSFNAKLDPASLEGLEGVGPGQKARGIRLRPGTTVNGVPFALDAADIADIRTWLLENGTVEPERKRKAERAAVHRARLASEIEDDLRSRLEDRWRAEFAAAQRADPIAYACEALRAAGQYVVEEAGKLKHAGSRLTMAGRGRGRGVKATELDKLTDRAKSLRCGAFESFKDACKVAGVMTRRGQS